MGFYLRKSIRVGPLRFNLSNSGVGVSTGVRGFRVGVGPRGHHVHMSLGGIHYRVTARTAIRQQSSWIPASHAPDQPTLPSPSPSSTHEPLRDIDSVAASAIVDSSSAELLREIEEKQRIPRLWPRMLGALVLFCFFGAFMPGGAWIVSLGALLGTVAVFMAHRQDIFAKTVVLFYEMDTKVEEAYGVFHQWAGVLASCSSVWHIEASGRVFDRKYHSGASSLVSRKPTFLRKAEPLYLRTNVETVALGVGRQVLYFFPDRVLVFDATGVGAVGYDQLSITVEARRFIEDGAVPPDAEIVDSTWQYVNRDGGPDRRFTQNRRLPICLYDEITLRSSSGLHEKIQLSRTAVGEGFAQAVRYLGQQMPREVPGVASSRNSASVE